MDTTASAPPLEAATTAAPRRVYRHRLPVRLMHWINVVCLVVLLGSGLNIFNAHPALYWGHDSSGKPWLSMRGENTTAGPIGKTRLGGITKAGDGYLRTLLVLGAKSVLAAARNKHDRLSRWAMALEVRRGYWKAVIAIAAKNARMAWAVLAKGDAFEPIEA